MVTALTYLTPPNEDENYIDINSDELVFFFLHLHNHFFFPSNPHAHQAFFQQRQTSFPSSRLI